MAFHLLYGENPGALLDGALGRICDEAVRWPTKRGYIIVPEKMKAEVERRYIELLKEKKGSGENSAFILSGTIIYPRRVGHLTASSHIRDRQVSISETGCSP